MDSVEVTFTPTKRMQKYQGTCQMLCPVTGEKQKPLLIIAQEGVYSLPRDKAAQLCADFPENFSSKERLDWRDRSLGGGVIHMTPGAGIVSADKNKAEAAPAKTK